MLVVSLRLRRSTIIDRLELLRLLADAFDDGGGELFRANFFFTDNGLENVIGVNAIFERTQPGIIDKRCYIRLTNMHQHQDRTQQKTGRIGEVLARTTWS